MCILWFGCNNEVLFLSVVAVISFIFFKPCNISCNTMVFNPNHHHGSNTTHFLFLFPSSEIWNAKPNTSSDFQICKLKTANLNSCESQKSQTTQRGQEKFDVTRLLLITFAPARTVWSRPSDDEPRRSFIEQSQSVAVTCRQPSTHSPGCQGTHMRAHARTHENRGTFGHLNNCLTSKEYCVLYSIKPWTVAATDLFPIRVCIWPFP